MAIGTTAALIGLGLAAGGGVASAAIGSKAANKAANTQAQAADRAAELQYKAQQETNALNEKIFNQQRADLEPWRVQGAGALGKLSQGLQEGGEFTKTFTNADFIKDPGYEARLAEGAKVIERSAAARGLTSSGRSLKELTRFGQDYASNEFSKAYDRFNFDRDAKYNKLAGLAGVGQTATAQTAQAGSNYASNVTGTNLSTGRTLADLMTSGANARAAGQVGAANAWSQNISSGINTGLSLWQMMKLFNKGNPYSPISLA